MWPLWKAAEYTIRGKVVASPKSGLGWILWVRSCLWFVLTPKVLQLCINHHVLVLCRFVWVIEVCQFFLVPSQSSSMPLYPFGMLWARERASTPYFSIVFNLDSHLSPSRTWECVYSINGYWWLFYYKLLLVIICYVTTIGDYFIINYCWILYVKNS
jgi:hypothetical protein